ncbi:Uncharacterised protein [Arcanobacterium haemolyticum]|uniref:Uncharacterized protein n=2 Tax=Arcanobacterium haemolyticum TaxID=28264 RepID=D7BL08_ARCHD|nr:hypothetical protein Arch_1652 [Arcanobacterium haemolyticum DSM 20595]SQH27818.1 Uncharacterised protein [Arcanobacterium haemolyticum]
MPSPSSDASGLAAQADRLYFASLTEYARQNEITRHQMERQHHEAMAMPQRQLNALQEVAITQAALYDEQLTQTGIMAEQTQIQSDIAYVRPYRRRNDYHIVRVCRRRR